MMEVANAAVELILLRHGLMMEKQPTATKAWGEQENNLDAAGELALARWVDGGSSPEQA